MCPGSHEPSLRRTPADLSPLGSVCTRAYCRYLPPHPMCHLLRWSPLSSCLLRYPVAAVCSGRSVVRGRLRYLLCVPPYPIPLLTLCQALLSPALVASSPAAALLLPLVHSASSAALPSGSGGQRWSTAPDTGRTRSCDLPEGRRTARSDITTVARNCSRHRRHDTPVVLVPWWLLTAPSPPPSPFIPPGS